MLKDDLNPTKARLFRITHRDNIPWILDNGCHCKNARISDPNFVAIGNPGLIDRRSTHPVPCSPFGYLSDYVPFYFTPFSPMFYNIKTGWNGIKQRRNDEIVILVSSIHKLVREGVHFLFTDRHAVLAAAQHFSQVRDLEQIDWALLQRKDFKRDPEDPRKVERYEAEALVYKHVPVSAMLGMICYNDRILGGLQTMIRERDLQLQLASRPAWYF